MHDPLNGCSPSGLSFEEAAEPRKSNPVSIWSVQKLALEQMGNRSICLSGKMTEKSESKKEVDLTSW